MALMAEFRRRVRDAVGPVLGLCMVGYFAYHTIEGERGLFAYVKLTAQLAEARAQLDELVAERKTLERRVGLLRSDNLDPDLLEERARIMLNLARPNEIVVVDPPSAER